MPTYTTVERLVRIRDNLAEEFDNETARRAAITAAGNPAPTTYTVSGKNFDWTGYVREMQKLIRDANQDVINAGGDGGLINEFIQGWV